MSAFRPKPDLATRSSERPLSANSGHGNCGVAEARKRRDARAGLAPALFFVIGALAAECRSPTIHLGLGDLARPDQGRDTCVVQLVAMPAHTVFQAPGFETPLATKPAIIVRAMPRVTMPCLRYADRANNESKGKKYCAIILHEQTLLTGNRALLKAGALAALSQGETPSPPRRNPSAIRR